MFVNVRAKWPVSDHGIWPPARCLAGSYGGVNGMSGLSGKIEEADSRDLRFLT
ncbi:hypothetical protein NBRC3293_3104 [Gluconobacter oxydans NBRC 3293]|uniref:Uncharacterized protein n=1 Tax=Gluconobacter oxydans NBRC 3293 TaxID=1315969 RepID=A0A829X0D7_GLUOY|nr:hypothetical protein NBRC3293_2948 [Gluconobacter oxydans NBRC 3293]GEM18607.1 hypothetical protein NBRC3293_3104 [Gluconobacter oxydans NBRC 3293]